MPLALMELRKIFLPAQLGTSICPMANLVSLWSSNLSKYTEIVGGTAAVNTTYWLSGDGMGADQSGFLLGDRPEGTKSSMCIVSPVVRSTIHPIVAGERVAGSSFISMKQAYRPSADTLKLCPKTLTPLGSLASVLSPAAGSGLAAIETCNSAQATIRPQTWSFFRRSSFPYESFPYIDASQLRN